VFPLHPHELGNPFTNRSHNGACYRQSAWLAIMRRSVADGQGRRNGKGAAMRKTAPAGRGGGWGEAAGRADNSHSPEWFRWSRRRRPQREGGYGLDKEPTIKTSDQYTLIGGRVGRRAAPTPAPVDCNAPSTVLRRTAAPGATAGMGTPSFRGLRGCQHRPLIGRPVRQHAFDSLDAVRPGGCEISVRPGPSTVMLARHHRGASRSQSAGDWK
jgi:hypothetical protein